MSYINSGYSGGYFLNRTTAIVSFLLAFSAFAHAADAGAPKTSDLLEFPPAIAAALEALPIEARPHLLKRARNGALYAKLPNGCEIIVSEKRSAPVVTVQGWMRTGGVNEAKWSGAGLSHFCEHMMFKGTGKRPTGVLDKEIRGAGGDDNAYTNSERTVYHITCQSSGFDTSFNVLADMLMDSTFPPDETVKEHSVVYKEIERFQDNPDGALYETFEQLVYQVHPYRIPVLGYPDRFKRVTHAEVWAYYQERYSPDNCCFIVAGDVDAKSIMPQMAKTLATWKRKSVEPAPIALEPEQLAPRSVSITHPLCQVPKLLLGYPGIPLRHDDLYALDLLASILGDGRASRLYREVKEKGLAFEISAGDYTPMYMGYFQVSATVDGEKIDAARAAILKVLEDAKTLKPSPEELARAKQKMKTARVMAQMTDDGLAEALGSDWFVAGDLDFSDRYVERIQQVSAEDVLRVARTYFSPEKLNVAIMRPVELAKEKAAAVKEKTADPVAALNAELAALKADAGVENAALIADRGVFEFKLKENGLRIVVREDPALPAASLAVAALGGLRWEPAELNGAGNLLGGMLDRGTATRNKLQLAEEVENLGASLSGFGGRASFGITATGLSSDMPKLLELAGDCLLHPAISDAELAQLKEDTLQQIAQENEDIINVTLKALYPLIYGAHPYARPLLGTPETVKKISATDLKRLHGDWVHPENIAISFAGDIKAVDALKLVRKNFGALKSGALKAPHVPPVPDMKAGGVTNEATKEGVKGAVLLLAFKGADVNSAERETLDLMAGMLSGLGGRLNTTLREKQGLAYSVGVFNSAQLDGGSVVFFIQTDAKSLDKSLAGMWGEVKLLRDETASAKELESVKNFLVGSEAIELQNQNGVAKNLALSQLYGQGAAHVFSRKERLEKVTPEMLQAAAKKFLDPDKWARAVLK